VPLSSPSYLGWLVDQHAHPAGGAESPHLDRLAPDRRLGLGLVLAGKDEELEGAGTWLVGGRESSVEVTTNVLGLSCAGLVGKGDKQCRPTCATLCHSALSLDVTG